MKKLILLGVSLSLTMVGVAEGKSTELQVPTFGSMRIDLATALKLARARNSDIALAREAVADEDDLAVLEHDLAVLIEAVAAVLVADQPARGHQDATLRPLLGLQGHGAVLIETPSRATILPRLITRRFIGRVATASAIDSLGSRTRSATQPTASP